MGKNGFLKRHGIVRSAIRKDLLYFAIPGFTVFYIELRLTGDGLDGFWGDIWELIKRPQSLFELPVYSTIGLPLVIIGLIIMLVGQITLWRNYSGTVLIRKDHKLVTHGIYRFVRNPMYFGLIIVVTGLPVYSGSLYSFLTSLVLIPIILNRIRLEEKLLTEEFQDVYQKYKETTKRLIPFIY